MPCVEVQTLREHTDQVLHLSFSHSGYQFASCSKDCTVKVRVEGGRAKLGPPTAPALEAGVACQKEGQCVPAR